MKLSQKEIGLLREKFLGECHRASLAVDTIRRYRSWIRRYLRWCKNRGVSPQTENIRPFLSCYESANSRRQGYFALKFLYTQAMRNKLEFTLADLEAGHPRPPNKDLHGWALFFGRRRRA